MSTQGSFHTLPLLQSLLENLSGLGYAEPTPIQAGAHIVVGTPGRIAKHIRKEQLPVDGIRTLVLDEADRLPDMGFEDLPLVIHFDPANDPETHLHRTGRTGRAGRSGKAYALVERRTSGALYPDAEMGANRTNLRVPSESHARSGHSVAFSDDRKISSLVFR